MTREEAITTLSFLRSECNCFDEGRERYHALSMAIEALSREPCEDCVSIQDAIDAIEEFADKDTTGTAMAVGCDYCIDIIKHLPSTQPEPLTD